MAEMIGTTLVVHSPGRINLIGEHIDYNEGFVLPAAIDRNITFTLKQNGTDKHCHIQSTGYGKALEVQLDQISNKGAGWENYILGVLHEIQLLTKGVRGFDCTIESDLPVGSGVSSSAALECGLAYGLNQLFDLGLEPWDLVKLSQRAEHNFAGTKCGIMDQFASVMGQQGHVMLLDCRSLEFEYIPMAIEPYRILMLNTNVAHNLASGEYNVRRQQCEEGLAIIQNHFHAENSLRSVSMQMLKHCKAEMDPIVYDRCHFVVEEIARVQEAVEALRENDLKHFGQLLYKTHQGLSKEYGVSCPELDFLVELAKEEPSILGARMMGGGFGGCTLNLIHKDAVDAFVEKAAKAYKAQFNIELSHFITVPSNGTRAIQKEA